MKQLDKSKRSSYSPVVFKHDCSLESTSGALEKKSNNWAFVLSRKFQDNSNMHLDFKN